MVKANQQTPSVASIVFAYLVVYIVWGSTFFFIEKALRSFSPFVLGSVRFIIAGTLLMSYCKLRGYKLYIKSAVKDALFIGFLLLFVDMAAIIWSEQYISSGIVSILSAATAIWFIVFDKPKWKQNFSSLPIVLGLLFGFIGVFMLFAEQIFSGTTDTEDKSMKLTAMIVLIFGTIGWTIGSLISKYSKEKKNQDKDEEDLHVMVKTAWQMVSAGVSFTIVALLSGEYARFDISAVTTADWGAMAYLATMGSILAFGSYIWLLQNRPATEVSTYAYINPIVALLLAHFFTSHQVTSMQILGLVVVLCSVMLMNWELYKDNKKFKVYKRAKRMKKLREMAPKSSIPRIIEISNFNSKHEKKKEKTEKQPKPQSSALSEEE
ncbi:EamA family transporter [Sphingobacterium psychroaquaticum]|uniref:Permease of the drug/metabolite transporter (DMT) superfamily n=1 Tax=Sphingobacterium psychroaquaticum TaxID=561061 RepID=A0A1X7JMP9_9SPHI|nr:EamA family transporter [Sphingobacterium psychroaquaticum]QBQ40828.1 EamA family transporter [Sphingobacterium psychroaquaticum]SMG29145.1 Permease of the drug/metabolite transporter (DMT) superfamily [Sphingobacterium psychroaquaticum]